MLEKTVFTNKTIISTVKKKYNIDIYKIEKLNRGTANIYSLNDNKYIFKEFQSRFNKKDIIKEIKIINHLRKDKLPVPEYIPTVTNRYYFTYKGKTVIMQKFIDGYTIESNTGTDEQILESAKYLGMMLKSLKTLEFKLPRGLIETWFERDLLKEGLEEHKELLSTVDKNKYPRIYDDLKDKIEILESIKKSDYKDFDKLTMMNTHGDFSVLQFIYKKDKVHAIIDFVTACNSPVIWEIIRYYSFIDPRCKDGVIDIPMFIKYVREVTKYIDLNEYDYRYMVSLYLVQVLASTFGYKQYLKDNTKVGLLEFGYFRTNLCRYMYKNNKKITDTLLKEFVK